MMSRSSLSSILVIDLQGFGKASMARQRFLRRTLREAIDEALERSRIPKEDLHFQDRGDGFLIVGPDPIDPVHFSHFLVADLRAELTAAEVKARAALHIGTPVEHGSGWVGEDVILPCRLVDCEELKHVLIDNENLYLSVMFSASWKHRVLDREVERNGDLVVSETRVLAKEGPTSAYLWMTHSPEIKPTAPTQSAVDAPSAGATFNFNSSVSVEKIVGRDEVNHYGASNPGREP